MEFETAVYTKEGQYAFHRSGNNVFHHSRLVYTIIDDTVFDTRGRPAFIISGVWWFAHGAPCFYQDEEIPEEEPQEEPEKA
jgi:hypothetical protein